MSVVVAIRTMNRADAPAAAMLMSELGYPTDARSFAERFAAVSAIASDKVLIAEEAGNIVGLAALHSFEMIHRPGRLGRVTALVVAEGARGRGIGGQLLAAAEQHLRALGCTRLEITSGPERLGAHRFYETHGYEERRVRFIKDVRD
jgi:GNAT superfamily N-acetyltransferase